jgi:hypothetical protein
MVQEEGVSNVTKPRCVGQARSTDKGTYEDKENEIWIFHGSLTVSAKAGQACHRCISRLQ